MTKKDLFLGLLLGFLIGILAIAVFKNLEADLAEKFAWFSLKFIYPFPIIIPILVVIGLSIANILGKKLKFIWQLAKFVVVGALNTFIDLGILGFLMWITGFEKGTQLKGKEFAGFYFVTGIGALINVGVAVFLVNVVGPQFHIAPTIWAGGVAPIIGVLCGFIWNFLSYKFFIFKK